MNLALFPLPIFILPNGVTRLRVFEPRYIRLVQESAGDIGFVIAPIENLTAIEAHSIDCYNNWGSWVKIIDFEQGQDGLLHIDVECIDMVRIYKMEVEEDGLKKVDVELFKHWQNSSPQSLSDVDAENFRTLSHNLKLVFQEHPDLENMYSSTKFDCWQWVCQRWLELLPLKQSERNLFAQPDTFGKANDFLKSIVFK